MDSQMDSLELLWKSLGEKIEDFLDTINLGDLLNEEAKLMG